MAGHLEMAGLLKQDQMSPDGAGVPTEWRIPFEAARAAPTGLGDQTSVARYEFTALEPMPCQLDGEIRSVPAHTQVCIESAPSTPSVIG